MRTIYRDSKLLQDTAAGHVTRAPSLGTLELSGITRKFGDTTALADFDLSVVGGEFIALLGPSGCGKSTALNCLAGLLPLTAGTISLDTMRIDTLPPERRDFGMVFQNYALFPHMTVAKNVGFGLLMRRSPKDHIEARVKEALALVKLVDQAHKLPGQLSGGQQQRVAIARAIALQPRLVLMDEPLSNLDAKLRIEMRGEIRRLHQLLGLTTVYVTHDQEEALSMADRLVVMQHGRIQQVGTPEEVYARPANAYVAGFMGYRNQLQGVAVSNVRSGVIQVGVGDSILTASAMTPMERGDAIALAIRPEELMSISSSDQPLDNNVLEAVPTVIEYQGTALSVQLDGPQGERLYIRVSGVPPTPGAPTRLTAPQSRILAYATPKARRGTEIDD